MSDLGDLASADERRAAAGEYVLGTLEEADRAAFVAALERDPALQAEVYAWQDQLLGLSSRAAPVDARPQLWDRISASVHAASAPASVAASSTPRASAPKASSPVRWWQRAAPWQGLSGLALAGLLLFALAPVLRPLLPGTAEARYVAVLQSPDDRSTGWIVEIDAGRELHLVPMAGAATAPAGRSLQFWTKPQGATGPTSLGLVAGGQRVDLPTSRLPALGEEQLFEITLEPAAGSPIGKPTGPVLYVGRTIRL